MMGTIHIVLAMKPMQSGFAENALKHGVAGINVDGCRVGTEAILTHGYKGDSYSQKCRLKKTSPELDEYRTSTGRFPANVIHDGSDEVVGLFPMTTTNSRGVAPLNIFEPKAASTVAFGGDKRIYRTGDADSGSAARFFKEVKG